MKFQIFIKSLLLASSLTLFSCQQEISLSHTKTAIPESNFNREVLSNIAKMPTDCGYATNRHALTGFQFSLNSTNKSSLNVTPASNFPTFCSAATYLVFLKSIDSSNIACNPETISAYLQAPLPDGQGIWGRWNSNGPAVAKFIHDLNAGISFYDLNEARPGDFMKIFWTDEIGKSERGHLVVFLNYDKQNQLVTFWSGNQPNGYGIKKISRNKIAWSIITRITNPSNLNKINVLPFRDFWLEDMAKKNFSRTEIYEKLH